MSSSVSRAVRTTIGVDASPRMLDVARERVSAAGVHKLVELRLGDLRDPPVPERVPLVLIPFRSLLHMTTEADRARALAAAHELLVPGGRLVFDVFAPSAQDVADTHGRWLEREPGIFERAVWDEGSRTLTLSVRSGEETVSFGLHWLSAPEWLSLLEALEQPQLACATLAVIMAGAYNRGEAAALFGVFLAMALVLPWYMAAPPKVRKGTVMNVGATLLGVIYVPFLASFALIILRIPGDAGRNLLLTLLGLTVLYDVCAYAIGSLWGNRPLAPTISPKKSWEGAVGATFVLLLVALAIVPSVEPFTAARAVGLALVIAVAAPLGDLVESALKRDLGLKDMGSLLPGHGGVLGRVDSILFAAPAAWYFIRLVIL